MGTDGLTNRTKFSISDNEAQQTLNTPALPVTRFQGDESTKAIELAARASQSATTRSHTPDRPTYATRKRGKLIVHYARWDGGAR